MNLISLKQQIDAEYGIISALIAKHPKLAVLITAVVCGALGHFL